MADLRRTGSLRSDDFDLRKLQNLQQTSDVHAYQRYFEMLQNLVLDKYPDLNESCFITLCINGLKDGLRSIVVSWCPPSVEIVFGIAFLKEYLISTTKDKANEISLPSEVQVGLCIDANDETKGPVRNDVHIDAKGVILLDSSHIKESVTTVEISHEEISYKYQETVDAPTVSNFVAAVSSPKVEDSIIHEDRHFMVDEKLKDDLDGHYAHSISNWFNVLSSKKNYFTYKKYESNSWEFLAF